MPKNEEDDLQKNLFTWVKFSKPVYPELAMLYHVPNGGKRNKIVATKLKQQGVIAGIFDLHFDLPANGYHGLRIELKIHPNKMSENQALYNELYKKYGYFSICYSGKNRYDVDNLINIITGWIKDYRNGKT